MPPTPKENQYTLPELVREVAKELGIDKLFDSPQGRAIIAGIVSTAIAEVETRLGSQLAEERKLRTAGEEAVAELTGRMQRREAFAEGAGFHRGIDGKIKPNVRTETATTLVTLIRALHTKDMDAVRAVSTGTGSEGGFLMQTTVAEDILRLIPEMGLYPQIARPWPMEEGLKVDIGSVLSGMGAYWPGENNAITSTFPTFGKTQLEGKLCGAYIPVPLALIKNAKPATGQLFADLIRECIEQEVSRVGFIGKSVANGGTDTFDGLVNTGSIVVVSLPTGKTKISDHNSDVYLSMQTAAPAGSARQDCGYVMDTTVLDSIRKVKTSTGDYVNAHFYTPPAGNEPAKLWGKPVYETSLMPNYSEASQPATRFALYGNFKKYALYGSSEDLTIATSDVAGEAFKNVQLAIRGITTVAIAAFGPAIVVAETAGS